MNWWNLERNTAHSNTNICLQYLTFLLHIFNILLITIAVKFVKKVEFWGIKAASLRLEYSGEHSYPAPAGESRPKMGFKLNELVNLFAAIEAFIPIDYRGGSIATKESRVSLPPQEMSCWSSSAAPKLGSIPFSDVYNSHFKLDRARV